MSKLLGRRKSSKRLEVRINDYQETLANVARKNKTVGPGAYTQPGSRKK